MSISLHSLLPYLKLWFLPPGLNCFVIFLGLLLWFYWRAASFFLIVIGALSLYLLSTPFVAYHLVGWLQDQYPVLKETDFINAKRRYAIVLLSGGGVIKAEYGNKYTLSDSTLHRMNYAVYLSQKMNLPIIFSGGLLKLRSKNEAEIMSDYLKENMHIKTDFIENKSFNTADESKLIASVLRENKFDGIYLVTHAWHVPRSMYIFQCRGIKTIPAPMGHYRYQSQYKFISYLPNMRAFYASYIALHEWIGLLWYHLYYGDSCQV